MDRWSIVTTLNYLPHDNEVEIVLAKAKHYRTDQGRDIVNKMVRVADLTRNAFMNGDLSTVMSPRTVITWAENAEIFRRHRLRLPADLPQQVRRAGAADRRRVLSALLRRGAAGIVGERGVELNGRACPASGAPVRTTMSSNMNQSSGQEEAPTEPFKRAVTGCLRAIAQKPELEGRVRRRAARHRRRQGAAARAAAQAHRAGRRDRARPCRLDRAQARLSRPGGASQARAGRPAGARGVRGGRAGARRGDRRAPHGRRGEEPLGHARRPLPPRQVRRGHRPRRCADRGSGRADGARAADRPGRRRRRRRSWSTCGGR